MKFGSRANSEAKAEEENASAFGLQVVYCFGTEWNLDRSYFICVQWMPWYNTPKKDVKGCDKFR